MNIFNYTKTRAFTLIELLVVIAIIGVLSTIIAQPVTQAYKKARDAKKIADIQTINSALQSYAASNNGVYPPSLDGLVATGDLTKLPTNAATTTTASDKYMYVTYADATSKIIGYHLGVKLEVGGPSLDGDKDCVQSAAGGCLSIASLTVATSNIGASGFATEALSAPTAGNDFDGGSVTADTSATICTSAIVGTVACVYDITQ